MNDNGNKRQIFRFTPILTEQCNLACKYCYVKDNPKMMSIETFRLLIKQAELKILDNFNVNIDLFGGEPLLLWKNGDLKLMIEAVVELEKKYPRRVRAIIFTNSVLLDYDILNFTRPLGCIHYNFSMDGCKEAHDFGRIHHDGSGSFEEVNEGIRKYCEVYGVDRTHISTKSMIAPSNLHFVMKNVKYLLSIGVTKIDMALVREAIWTDEDVIKYEEVIRELANWYADNIDLGLWCDLFAIPLLDFTYQSRTFCGAGVRQWGISPDGDIYPCQRFYNNRSPFKMGDLEKGLYIKSSWSIFFQNYSAKNFNGCSTCDTFKDYNCLGQCVASMWEDSGTKFKCISNVCKLHKINYKVARELEAKLKGNPNWEKTIDPASYGG